MDPEPPRPTLTPTRSGAGYRLPALAIGVALIALVAVTRLGGTDRPTPSAAPSALVSVPTVKPADQRPGAMPVSVDGLTYADGIPTDISGLPVYRVRDALLVPSGRTLLVGGWYLHRSDVVRECAQLAAGACASPTISDVPLAGPGMGDVATAFVALDSRLSRTGAYIVLATVETDPRCSIRAAGECQPRLRVLSSIWSG